MSKLPEITAIKMPDLKTFETADEITLAPMVEVKNPLENVVYNGSIEKMANEEWHETKKAFRDQAKQEKKNYQNITDSEYWVCLCFQNRAQKEEYLAKAGIAHLGDKYVDGQKVAKIQCIEITKGDTLFFDKKSDKKLEQFGAIRKL